MAGIRISTVVPRPTWLATEIFPPCASIRIWQEPFPSGSIGFAVSHEWFKKLGRPPDSASEMRKMISSSCSSVAIVRGRRACELLPVSKDSWDGPSYVTSLAMIYAWTGAKTRALVELARSARLPGGVTYGELKLSPQWDALRGDPQFEKNCRLSRAGPAETIRRSLDSAPARAESEPRAARNSSERPRNFSDGIDGTQDGRPTPRGGSRLLFRRRLRARPPPRRDAEGFRHRHFRASGRSAENLSSHLRGRRALRRHRGPGK